MFGLALRTYLRRIQRLRASSTEHGRSLWEAVYAYLGDGALIPRAQILKRFHRDDPELVNGVLHDMNESGLLLRLGKGPDAAFRAASEQELDSLQSGAAFSDELLWALIYREGPLSRSELERRVRYPGLDQALERLCGAGRIERDGEDGAARYATQSFVVPLGASSGWEAAVFDHFQAVVRTITSKLRDATSSHAGDVSGGSTYDFDVWPGHPLHDEVLGQLRAFRAGLSALRDRVSAHNRDHVRPHDYLAVTIYAGQSVTPEGDAPEHEPAAGREPAAQQEREDD
jgi:hypothetical protein